MRTDIYMRLLIYTLNLCISFFKKKKLLNYFNKHIDNILILSPICHFVPRTVYLKGAFRVYNQMHARKY